MKNFLKAYLVITFIFLSIVFAATGSFAIWEMAINAKGPVLVFYCISLAVTAFVSLPNS